MEELTLENITKVLKNIISEEDLQLYKDLGNGLYELPCNIITNKNGLKEYLDELRKKNTTRLLKEQKFTIVPLTQWLILN